MVNQFYKCFFKQNNNWWQQSIPKLFFHISVLFLNVIKENKKTPFQQETGLNRCFSLRLQQDKASKQYILKIHGICTFDP